MPFAALIGGRQALWRQVLLNSCRADTGLVVELGAGWGNNLLDLFTGGGPLRATYAALEPTSSGREALTLLATLDRKLKAFALDFDYRSPDYDRLPRGASHALVFTSHSIEQVADLPREAIIGLLDVARDVTGVHFEPIGWQMRDAMGQAPAEQGATLAYAEAKNYNRNLWSVLRALEAEGRIAIREAVPDIFCHKPVNVSSLVVWEKLHSTRGRSA